MRVLPSYTKGEEIFNMISHIVGGALGITALVLCVVFAAVRGDAWGVVSGALYGASLVILYTMSSIYHGLHDCMGKRVLQVLDHCSIYFLIGGSYTPILLVAIRRNSPAGHGRYSVLYGALRRLRRPLPPSTSKSIRSSLWRAISVWAGALP